VIFNEETVGDRGWVTTDEKQVLRGEGSASNSNSNRSNKSEVGLEYSRCWHCVPVQSTVH